MKFTCQRCGGVVPVGAEAQATGFVACPHCQMPYQRTSPSTGATTAPDTPPPTPAPTRTASAPPATESSTFGPGDLVAGRYRIRRWLARGGMGEVYEADDLELQGVVALKTLRPSLAAEPNAVERLRREIQMARKVTHANVCRVFDLGHHIGEQEGGRQVLFLTMEFVPGETLAQRIEAHGRLTADQALPIARHMAEALAAAHRAGIVHRDFKPDNVFLTPDPAEPNGLRAMVADFGIARSPELGSRLTAVGDAIGTPAYMAPEQLEGHEPRPATDIYAFGLVLYEMVTGRLPFQADTAISVAVKRLVELPPPPRTLVAELPQRWETVILRCLERLPEDRFASPLEAVAALDPDAAKPAIAPTRAAARSAHKRKVALGVLAALFTIAAATAVLRVRALRHVEAMSEQVATRRGIAVLSLRNASGRPESAWISTALAEMLTTELANGKGLRAVPGNVTSRVQADLGLGEAAPPEAAGLAQIRARLGVEYLIAGAYAALGEPGKGQLRVDLRLLDATTGETRLDVSEEGPEADLIRIAGRAGEKLRTRLGAPSPVAASLWSPERWTPEATRLYSEGLARLRAFDARGARDALEQAVAADPKSPHVRAALAEAWTALGYGEKGRAEATRALELATDLPDGQRLPIEAACRQKFGEWQLAADLYRRLVTAAPDDLEAGLQLVAALSAAGRQDEASAEVKRLTALPAGAADARVTLAAASVAERRGEYSAQLAAARRALELASGQNAREFTARAQLGVAAALRSLGQPEPAGQAAAQARQIFAAIGDGAGETAALLLQGSAAFDRGDLETAVARSSDAVARARSLGDAQATASALNALAVAVRNQGDLEAAGKLYEEALAATREVEAKAEEATLLHNLGALHVQRGQLELAGQHFEKALAMWKQLGDTAGTATGLGSLGGLLEREGDLPAARARFEEAIALRRSLGQKGAELAASVGLGRLLLAQGDLAAARERFTAALDGCRETGFSSCVAHSLSGLGAVALEAAQFQEARARYSEVLKLRQASGEKMAGAETRVALAQVADAEGRGAEAVESALQAMHELREHGAGDAAALAGAVLLRAATGAGDRAAARNALNESAAAWASTASPAIQVAGKLAQARWAEVQGSRKTALEIAHEASTLATRHGLTLLALEARGLAAKIAQDRSALAEVRQEASAKGLERIAKL